MASSLYSAAAMPIYEYRCENGHLFEVMQKITDDPVTHCQECDAAVQALAREHLVDVAAGAAARRRSSPASTRTATSPRRASST